MRWETFKFWNLVQLILYVWRLWFIYSIHLHSTYYGLFNSLRQRKNGHHNNFHTRKWISKCVTSGRYFVLVTMGETLWVAFYLNKIVKISHPSSLSSLKQKKTWNFIGGQGMKQSYFNTFLYTLIKGYNDFMSSLIADIMVSCQSCLSPSAACHLPGKWCEHDNPKGTVRSWDRFISTMGFPLLVRWHLYIEPGPWWPCSGPEYIGDWLIFNWQCFCTTVNMIYLLWNNSQSC